MKIDNWVITLMAGPNNPAPPSPQPPETTDDVLIEVPVIVVR
jgi:hypothetical protein